MRFLVSAFLVACLLTPSVHAAEDQGSIELRYLDAADATETISKVFGAKAASAILSTDTRRNSITLRLGHPDAPKVRELLAALDRKRETIQVAMIVTLKTPATPDTPAEDRILSKPTIVGLPGQPMIVTFEQDGKTFQIEISATIQRP